MKRILTVTLVVLFVQTANSFQSTLPQRTTKQATLRRFEVNAKTISALTRGKKYVVNLTQRGVKYEFDPKAGEIDLRRVTIRTAKGDVALSSFLEKNFPDDKAAGFKMSSHAFILGTKTVDTLPPMDEGTAEARLGFSCGSLSCDCVGDQDCGNLIFRSRRCRSMIFCWIGDDGKTHCHCRQIE